MTNNFFDYVLVLSKIKGIKKSEYKSMGKFPIIDQGQNLVTAYSDKEDLVENNIPFIVFGDHTRILKYINFPSILSNDGVKVLKPKLNLDSKYLYYQLLNLKIPNTGYNRHFKYLVENNLIIPSLEVQQKVVSILSSVDEVIQNTDQIIEKIKQIKKSFIQNLFSSKTGINWPMVKLNDVSIKITDGTHRTPKYIGSGIPFLRINDIQSEKINWERVKYISEEEHGELIRRCHPEKGDVLLSKNGTIGITKIVDWERDFSIFVSLCLIKPDISKISTEYLNVVLGSDYLLSQIKKRSKQGTVTNLHLEEIRDLNIALPSVDEQLLIAKQYDYLVEKINNELHYKNKLVQLKNGLMNDIFNQKVEVSV